MIIIVLSSTKTLQLLGMLQLGMGYVILHTKVLCCSFTRLMISFTLSLSYDEDEALARAVAASLAEQESTGNHRRKQQV